MSIMWDKLFYRQLNLKAIYLDLVQQHTDNVKYFNCQLESPYSLGLGRVIYK